MRAPRLLHQGLFVCLAWAALSAACGSRPPPQLPRAAAQQAYGALQTVLKDPGVQDANQLPALECRDGGHVRVAHAPVMGEQVVTQLVYEACRSGDITFNGTYTTSANVRRGHVLPPNAVIQERHSGRLTFSGSVEGSCDVELRLDLRADLHEVFRAGTFCGHDVATLQLPG